MLRLYLCMPAINNKYMQTQAITCWENMSFTNVQSNFRQQGRQLKNKSVNKNSTQVLIWKVIHIWSLNWQMDWCSKSYLREDLWLVKGRKNYFMNAKNSYVSAVDIWVSISTVSWMRQYKPICQQQFKRMISPREVPNIALDKLVGNSTKK
jgi:hypothetical protein